MINFSIIKYAECLAISSPTLNKVGSSTKIYAELAR